MMSKNLDSPLISVIMPFYNSEQYLADAIISILNQDYNSWELLIVNDGSIDQSEAKVLSFADNRIRYYKQEKKGVSAARNLGLQNMNGKFFCFLDSDDVLPVNSLSSRYKVFINNSEVDFVDGKVQYVDEQLSPLSKSYKPNFYGDPYKRLIELDSSCYFGNTWMIKRDKSMKYKFDTNISHAEDLLFYISISKGKLYYYTNDYVLLYRQRTGSAMSNTKGLEDGYFKFYNLVKKKSILTKNELIILRNRIKRVLIKSYVRSLNILSAFKVLVRKL